jgi:hypothetical protein
MGKKIKDSAPPTSGTILQELLALEKHLSRQDPFRTDQYGLFAYLEHLLSDEAANILRQEPDPQILPEVLRLSLACGKYFNYMLALRLAEKLHRILPAEDHRTAAIVPYLRGKKREARWERWKVPVLLVITVVICLLIFRLA